MVIYGLLGSVVTSETPLLLNEICVIRCVCENFFYHLYLYIYLCHVSLFNVNETPIKTPTKTGLT